MSRAAARCALAAALSAAGCATSRSLGTLEKKAGDAAQRLESLRRLEAVSPERALAGYRLYLAAEAKFDKPLLYYQRQLEMQLRQMQTSRAQVLGEDVLSAFPPFYHRRLEGLLAARLGAARMLMAQGDLAEAERLAAQSLRLVERRSRSDVHTARLGMAAAGLSAKIYEARASAGPATLARFRETLFRDFMGSPYARTLSAQREREIRRIAERIAEIDRFVAKVNRSRTAAAAAELAGAVAQTAGGFSFGGTASKAAAAASAATNVGAKVMDMSLQFASIPEAIGSPTPAADRLLMEQLWDPRKGTRAAEIVRLFAEEAAAFDGEARREAGNLLRSLDAFLALRAKNEQIPPAPAAEEFLRSLTTLQKRLASPPR